MSSRGQGITGGGESRHTDDTQIVNTESNAVQGVSETGRQLYGPALERLIDGIVVGMAPTMVPGVDLSRFQPLYCEIRHLDRSPRLCNT